MSDQLLAEASRIQALIVGASQGIGLGFVRTLLEDDRVRQLFATYRDPVSASELLALRDQHADRLTCLRMDVTEEEQIAAALLDVRQVCEELNFVVYCAGVLHEGDLKPEKSLEQLSSEHLLRSFGVNSVGAALLAKHLVPLLPSAQPSIFACISAKVGSISDNRLGGWYGYRASKAALNMLVKTISIEYRRRCPRTAVVALHPGTTDTRLSKPFQGNVREGQLSSVKETVALLLGVLGGVTAEDSGRFLSWDGSELPW